MNPLALLESYSPALGNAAGWVVIVVAILALFRSIVLSQDGSYIHN